MSSSARQLSTGWRQSKTKHMEAGTSTIMGEHVLSTPAYTNVLPTPAYTNGGRWDRSNLDCILEYTTPSVQCRYQCKYSEQSATAESAREPGRCHCEYMPFFNLGDLWQSFDEWSAYGAEVPLKLPSGETIVQYYVPYLSALQIYMHSGSNGSSNKRRLGDESDWSDTSDVRDTSSDLGSDNENEKLLSRLQIGGEKWESSSSSSTSSEQGDRHGELAFEYFERCSPYGRAPLTGKINGLASRFPPLLSLRSNELSPESWLSVAWYPIYRIPMGHTMSDLSTCFLTFHTLWTPPCLQDLGMESRAKGCEVDPHQLIDLRHRRQHHENECGSSMSLPESCSCKLEQEQWLGAHSAWRMKSGILELPAFGLASYKLRGPFWASAAPADKQRALMLSESADSWLKQLRVQHPDYDFFSSREVMKFDSR